MPVAVPESRCGPPEAALVGELDWSSAMTFRMRRGDLCIDYSGGADVVQLSPIDARSGFFRAPYGVSDPFPGSRPGSKLSLSLEVHDGAVCRALIAVDAAVKRAVSDHAVSLYGRSLTEEELDALYVPLTSELPVALPAAPASPRRGSAATPRMLRVKVPPPGSPGCPPVTALHVGPEADELLLPRSAGVSVVDALMPKALVAPLLALPRRVWKLPNGKCGVSMDVARVAWLRDDGEVTRGPDAFAL